MGSPVPLYSPLDPVRKQIRVLEIVSVQPRIVCTLHTVALPDNPLFQALSYTWGDARKQELIIINNHPVSVTRNLACALRSVHFQWNKVATPIGINRMWADAVCINQGDAEEKSHQIPLMRNIYTSARIVFVWLASSPTELRASFNEIDAIKTAADRYSRLPEDDQKQFLIQWPNDVELLTASGVISVLFKDEYWTRVWTFQEIVLGRDVRFIAGEETMAFKSLVSVGTFLRRYMEGADAYGMNPQSNAKLWLATRGVFRMLDVIFDIGEMKEMVEAMATRSPEDTKLAFEDLGLLGLQMSRCCTLATERRATEPKDYVYGFSALLDLQLAPDYSPEISIASTYCDLMEQALASGGNMCLLLLDTAGVGHAWDLLPGLPSWGPNFASAAKVATSNQPQAIIKANWVSFVGLHDDRPPNIERVTSSLFCTAVILDSFAVVGPSLLNGLPDSEWIIWLYHFLKKPTPKDNMLAASHLRTIIAAIVKSTSVNHLFHPPTTMFGVTNGDYITHNILLLVLCLDHVWVSLGTSGDKDAFLKTLLSGSISHYYGTTTMLSAYEALLNCEASYLRQLEEAWTELCSLVEALRIACTSASHLGLFPPRIQNGDVIAMINACTNPAILRKTSNCYAFVGWCYVSEYDDRPIDALVEGGLGTLERLELR